MMSEKILDTQEHKIMYRVTGEGTPVVLIHGFGEDGTIWESLSEALKTEVRFLVPDLPGSGQSVMRKNDWSMESFSEAVRLMLDHEQIEKCIMIGHSMGGYITLAFAEKYPEYLKAFGLFHSTAFADDEEKKVSRRRGIEFIGEHGAARFLEQATPKLFSDSFKEKNPQIIQELIQRYTNFQDASLVYYYEAMMQRPDRTHVLKSYPGAILFIMGEHDTAIPLSDGLRQCHMPHLSYIHILKNSGHMGMIEETDECRKILQKFIQDYKMIGTAGN